LVAADTAQIRSVVRMKSDLDKTMKLTDKTMMLLAGSVGACSNFGDLMAKNIKLNGIRNGYDHSPAECANFVRKSLADALRTREAYQVNLLLGGYDAHDGPELYYIDYFGAMAKVPFGAHGYGSFFTLATLDRHYKEGMNFEEAKDVMRKCIEEVRTRFIVNMPAFTVRVIDREGTHEVTL